MKKAVLVICEGLHDVIFVQRSLGAVAGCEWFDGTIQELPSPFGGAASRSRRGLIATRMARDVEGLTLRETSYSVLPHFESAVEDKGEETYFMQIRTSGDGKADAVVDLLKDLDVSFDAGPMDISREYAVAFLFDANSGGLRQRVETFRAAYERHFGSLASADHARWLRTASCHVGLFVFHRSSEEPFGTLEDHLAPMAKATWPEYYDGARAFIDDNRRDGDAPSTSSVRRLKAIITAAAQFDHPGAPLSTAVARCGIPRAQFEQCPLSHDLARFLQDVPWRDNENQPAEAH